jgi:uncharacterized membrane protein
LVTTERRAATAAGFVSVALWASAFVGIRAAGPHFAPGPLAVGRLLIGSIVLGLIVAIRREPLPARRDLPAIVLCGLLWFALYNVALNAGERHVDAGTASMIIRVGPVMTAILAGLFLGEGFSSNVFAGGAIALAGAAVIAAASEGGGVVNADGVLLCLLAAAAYAGGVVTEKVVLRRVSPLQTVFVCCLRARWEPGLARVPRRLPDRDRLHHVGVRARPKRSRAARGARLSRSADLDRAGVVAARRDAAAACSRRWRDVPLRRRAQPAR